MKRVTVKGFLSTWTIEETKNGFLVKPNRRDKPIYYKSLSQAHAAIRFAENACLFARGRENCVLKNRDIWADFGVLWVDNFDGGYYE